MPFIKRFNAECIPEWRKAYIDYNGLSVLISTLAKQPMGNGTACGTQPNAVTSYASSSQHACLSDVVARNTESDYAQFMDASPWDEEHILSQGDIGFLYNLLTHGTAQEKTFFRMLDQQLDKVSQFFDEREYEAQSNYTALQIQMKLCSEYGELLKEEAQKKDLKVDETSPLLPRHHPDDHMHDTDNTWPLLDKKHHHIDYQAARTCLKKAMAEFYHSLQYLQSFRDLNMQAFQKLLKKFDKVAGWKATIVYMKKVRERHWASCSDVMHMREKTEELYANTFTRNNRHKARQALQIFQRAEVHTSTSWRVGFYFGACLTLFIQAVNLALDPETSRRIPHLTTHLQIYAAFSIPIILLLGISVNMFVWTRYRISYQFLFEFDPKDHVDYHQFAELPALFLLLLLMTMYSDFSQWLEPMLSSQSCPLAFFVVTLCICACPFNIFYRSARKWLAISLGRIIVSPFVPVEFRDLFIGNDLNSLAYTFWTATYFFCAYACNWTELDEHCSVTHMWITPFLAILPPWWRLLQCFRCYHDSGDRIHILNAIKYTTSIVAAFMTAIRRMRPSLGMDVMWVLCSLINSSYTSVWDIKIDWGLSLTPNERFLLRDDLLFPVPIYYVCAVVNVMVRFAWTLNIAGLTMHTDALGYLIALLETYRRFQWNFFRLECEHLNNCAKYRVINEIPLPFPQPEDIKLQDERTLCPPSEEEPFERLKDWLHSILRLQSHDHHDEYEYEYEHEYEYEYDST